MEKWLQIRGDPAVRQFLFEQRRVDSAFDMQIDRVLARIRVLLSSRGVFHAKIHFSTGQVTLWFLHNPWTYRVHLMEEFLSPAVCRLYPQSPYPTEAALVPCPAIGHIFAQFKRLRLQDAQVYLRTGSVNIISGAIGLRFSCDGSHYLDYAEFLEKAHEI
ncbi:MAG: hypothetical protein ACYDEV_07340 [Acidiferrobacter sp.]